MSFAPLPDAFLRDIDRCRATGGVIVDLGCADGAFFAGVDTSGARLVGLDRLAPAAGTSADVVGDALAPPLRPGRADLVVAGNLLRHIVPRTPADRILECWTGLVAPGGALYVFEDEPDAGRGPAGNYRRLQEFLCELMPEGRGPLLPRRRFERIAGGGWTTGTRKNGQRIDPQAVCALLAGDGRPGDRARGLIEDIRTGGIDCGDYWWACRRRVTKTENAP